MPSKALRNDTYRQQIRAWLILFAISAASRYTFWHLTLRLEYYCGLEPKYITCMLLIHVLCAICVNLTACKDVNNCLSLWETNTMKDYDRDRGSKTVVGSSKTGTDTLEECKEKEVDFLFNNVSNRGNSRHRSNNGICYRFNCLSAFCSFFLWITSIDRHNWGNVR